MQINRKVRPEILDSVALLVIDAQDCFLDTLHNKESFMARAAFAIEAARSLKIHTLFTEQAPEKLGRTNADLFKLAKHPKVFSKQCFSALGAPGIERYLRDKEIYHLLVVGLEVPICIYQTGLQATDEDVDVTFLSDCLGSRRAADEAPVLQTLVRLGCQVLPSETVFYSLLGDTLNPYFRPFNQIVKAFGQADFNLETYLANRPQPVRDQEPSQPKTHDRPVKDGPPRENPSHSNENNADNSGESERRKNRRRRRGRGRNRESQENRQDSSGNQSRHSDSPKDDHEKPRENRPAQSSPSEAPSEKPSSSANEPATPKAISPKPEKAAEGEAKPVAKKAAKKAAKKTAKKAAKKATKKTAKKAAKKVAKKTAKPSEPAPASDNA